MNNVSYVRTYTPEYIYMYAYRHNRIGLPISLSDGKTTSLRAIYFGVTTITTSIGIAMIAESGRY